MGNEIKYIDFQFYLKFKSNPKNLKIGSFNIVFLYLQL